MFGLKNCSRYVSFAEAAFTQFVNGLCKVARDVGGNTAIVFTLTLPILIGAVGGAIDYGYAYLQKSKLQNTTDAAAIAAARELHLASTEPGQLQAIVDATFAAAFKDGDGSFKTAVSVADDLSTVTVDAKFLSRGFFLSQFKPVALGSHAVARVSGGSPLCVLALDESDSGNITLQMSAKLSANACAVYSNSTSMSGIVAKNSAVLESSLTCSAGGVSGSGANFRPEPLSDCPPMPDPLAGRAPPSVGSCTANKLSIGAKANKGKQVSGLNKETKKEEQGKEEKETDDSEDNYTATNVTLSPGTYCGGIAIGGAAHVTLEPGIYVLKDGPLFITDFATLEGKNVGFYFLGQKSTLFFGPNTTISLVAPEVGDMAGLLMFQDRDSKPDERFSILSDNARLLEGTLYIPAADLYIDADQPIADQSAYTVIIANSMSLYAGPHVVLNTDYDDTDVPVPAAVASDRRVTLVE